MTPRPPGDPTALTACATQIGRVVAELRDAAEMIGRPTASSGLGGPAGHRIADDGRRLSVALTGLAERLALLSQTAVAAAHGVADAQRTWDRREQTRRDAAAGS